MSGMWSEGDASFRQHKVRTSLFKVRDRRNDVALPQI